LIRIRWLESRRAGS